MTKVNYGIYNVNLTAREKEVLQLIAEGSTSKEIGGKLHISHKTAEAHRENIKKKLDIHTVAELVRYAIGIGLVEPVYPAGQNA